jgi:hypothetical protein
MSGFCRREGRAFATTSKSWFFRNRVHGRKSTEKPATSGNDVFVVVARHADAEDGDQDADELDCGVWVPSHCNGGFVLLSCAAVS